MAKRTVAVNDLGLRIGEDHPMAKLTNADIERLLQLRADTGWGYKRLGRIFEISPSQVKRIVQGQHRGQAAMGYRTIEQE
ncbi:hypothetical protein [Cupriavidus sp. 2SB]|uniref:hypothetical protein n=1 Tax=Cupriavidus sp. 2SB TaxID=2502199 RepID=UPI0010F994F9|nr:hypothetical protein [Cupriavidus sp. 2SB]